VGFVDDFIDDFGDEIGVGGGDRGRFGSEFEPRLGRSGRFFDGKGNRLGRDFCFRFHSQLWLGLNFFRFKRESFGLELDFGRGFWRSKGLGDRGGLNCLRFKRDRLGLHRRRCNLFG